MRRFARALAAISIPVAALAVSSPAPVAAAVCSADPTVGSRSASGPYGPIGFVGDSTGIGMIAVGGLVDQLGAAGWGPVQASAICGGQTTINAWSGVLTVNHWRANGFDPAVVLVGLGSNDVGYCHDDVAACRARIEGLLATIGDREVVWQNISHPQPTWRDAWNAALAAAAKEHPLLHVVDWQAKVVADPSLVIWDQVHSSGPAAYRLRAGQLVDGAGAWHESGAVPANPAPSASPIGEPAGFTPLPTPVRAADTREGRGGARLAAGEVRQLDLATLAASAGAPAGVVSTTVTAAAVNITVDAAGGSGYLTAWSCDGPAPTASVLNYPAARPRAAHAVIPLSAARLCLVSKQAAHVIVDVSGVYGPQGTLGFVPAAPHRLVDTRTTSTAPLAAGSVTRVPIPPLAGGPAASVVPDAVMVNVTGVGATSPGYVSVFPCDGAVPSVSALNLDTSAPRANLVQTRVGDGAICLLNQSPVHLVVDLAGTYDSVSADRFRLQAVAPARLLDTRAGVGGWLGATAAGQTVSIDASSRPAGARGELMTVTATAGDGDGYVTVFPCDSAPPVASNLNHTAGETVANAASVAGAGCVTTQVRAQLLVDLAGWWVP